MTGKRKAWDDAPGTPWPPAPRREAESDEEYLSPSAYLVSGDSWSDGEQSPRAVLPPPPPRDTRSINVMSARVLSDGGTAAGEENEVSSPWRLVALSELIVLQPAAADQPAAAVAQANHSSAEAVAPAPTPAPAPAPETAACAPDVCFSFPAGPSDGGSAAGEEEEVSSPWKFVRLSELTVPQPLTADQSAAVRAEICQACRRRIALMPWAPYRHVCFCATCRYNPSARISCCVCGAGRRSWIKRVWS
ncbi:hypothetical protein ACQ4PT_023594 [Festuca glaucescens]